MPQQTQTYLVFLLRLRASGEKLLCLIPLWKLPPSYLPPTPPPKKNKKHPSVLKLCHHLNTTPKNHHFVWFGCVATLTPHQKNATLTDLEGLPNWQVKNSPDWPTPDLFSFLPCHHAATTLLFCWKRKTSLWRWVNTPVGWADLFLHCGWMGKHTVSCGIWNAQVCYSTDSADSCVQDKHVCVCVFVFVCVNPYMSKGLLMSEGGTQFFKRSSVFLAITTAGEGVVVKKSCLRR